MTPTKYTQQRTVWDYSVSVCVYSVRLHKVDCVCVFDPLLHRTVIKAEIGWRGALRGYEKTVRVSLVGSLWGITESST